MIDPSRHVEHPEYVPTVPKSYICLAWLWVLLPFGYGVWQLLGKLGPLFAS